MAVDVFVEKVSELAWTTRIAGLRAKGAQPHIVTRFHFDPVLIEAVDGLAFKNIEAVFHDMGFEERNDCSGFKGHDRDVHVVTKVCWVHKSGRCPFPIRFGHDRRRDVLFVGHERFGMGQSFNGLVGLSDPVEPTYGL